MTATQFLDDYSDGLHHTALNGPLASRPLLRGRVRDFRKVRDELRSRGVSDADILSKIGEIMGYILAHLGDLAAILALVLPLFMTPAPKASERAGCAGIFGRGAGEARSTVYANRRPREAPNRGPPGL